MCGHRLYQIVKQATEQRAEIIDFSGDEVDEKDLPDLYLFDSNSIQNLTHQPSM